MNDHNHKESLCWLTLFNADIIKESCFAQVDQHSACFNHQMVILAFVPVSGYFSDICCFVNTILVPQCLSYRVFFIEGQKVICYKIHKISFFHVGFGHLISEQFKMHL